MKSTAAQAPNQVDGTYVPGADNNSEQTVVLPLSALKLDPEIQCRMNGVSQRIVQLYSDRMKAGDDLGPLDVVEVGTELLVADGFHRHAAAMLAGLESFRIRIRRGTRSDAIELAIRRNLPHGRQFAPKDRRRMVEQALKYCGEKSDGAIAEMCQVSQSYVSRIHRQLRTLLSSEGPQATIGRDGKKRRPPQKRASIGPSGQQFCFPEKGARVSVPKQTRGARAAPQGAPTPTNPVPVNNSPCSDTDQRLLRLVERELFALPPGSDVSLIAQCLLDLSMACNLMGNRRPSPGELERVFGWLAEGRSLRTSLPARTEVSR